MKQVIIDGVLHNYEYNLGHDGPRDPSLGARIFTCPAGEKFVRKAQHDFSRGSICGIGLFGKFRTNGHTYEFP